MKISELLEKLGELQAIYGDIEVKAYGLEPKPDIVFDDADPNIVYLELGE